MRLPNEDVESLGVPIARRETGAEIEGRVCGGNVEDAGDGGTNGDCGVSERCVRVGDLGGTGGGGDAERGGTR